MIVNLKDDVLVKVVSLKTDHDRRAAFDTNNREFLREFDFFDAFDGRQMNVLDFYANQCMREGRSLRRKAISPAELGCFLSHKLVLESFINEPDYNFLMVLEDDVKPFGKKNTNEITIKEDRINILGGQEGLKRSYFWEQLLSRGLKFRLPAILGFSIYRTCSYLVSKDVAQKILDLMNDRVLLADDWGYIAINAGLKGFYMQKIFSHPRDLTESHIELQRKMND
jgi:glycosyl transferase family 25